MERGRKSLAGTKDISMSYQTFVCACDKYSWIYPDFIRLADPHIAYSYIFFTEEYEDDDYRVVPVGKGLWYERMLRCLTRLTARDVIYLQEDFLIKSVNEHLLEEAYCLHKKKNAYITKIGNNYEFKTCKYPTKIDQHQVYIQDIADVYLMSHQPVAIFNRQFLIDSLVELKPAGPSEHEIDGSKWMRASNKTRVFCIGESHYPKNYSEIFNFEHAIRKGKILPDAINLLGDFNEKTTIS